MRIRKSELKRIIREEYERVLSERDSDQLHDEDDDDESENERKERLFPGFDDLRKLSHGVTEKKKRKPQCHAYAANHGLDGRFVNPEDEAGSYSMKATDSGSPDNCDHGKASRKKANRSHQWVKQPCGRGSKYRCKDGSEKWEEELINEDEERQLAAYIASVVADEIKKFIKQFQKLQQSNRKGSSCTIQDLNALASASKGALNKDKKK